MADYDPRTDTGIPTEQVGSLPRPAKLQEAYAKFDAGEIEEAELEELQDAAAKDSIEQMEATGSPIVSDGEQRWSSFATYPIATTLAGTGLAPMLGPGGQFFAIFADGHGRQLPKLRARAVRLQPVRGRRVEEVDPVRVEADEAGRHRAVDAGAAVPAEGPGGGLQPRGVRGRADRRVREGHPAGVRGRGRAGVGGLHRGAAGHPRGPAQPVDGGRAAAALHRADQRGDGPVLRRGAQEHRRAHVPGRRPRLRALGRRALQQPAQHDVRHQRGLLPHPARVRARPRPGVRDHRQEPPLGRRRRGADGLPRHDRHAVARGSSRRRRSPTSSSGRRTSSTRTRSARRTTAASRRSRSTRSPTTARRTTPARWRSARSSRASRARGMAAEKLGI